MEVPNEHTKIRVGDNLDRNRSCHSGGSQGEHSHRLGRHRDHTGIGALMKRLIVLLGLIVMIAGCATTYKPAILTSKEESWYIPKGTEFQAKKTATDTLTKYQAGDDLMVLYMGKYLEVEKQANKCSH
jgi:hypothetical protein